VCLHCRDAGPSTNPYRSIQLQGRFLKPANADEVVFGNVFSKPIRDHLPYGTSAALKVVRYIDPSLEQDVYADEPWAWSPLIATMNVVKVTKLDSAKAALPAWSAKAPEEDVSPVMADKELMGRADARRKYFATADHRKTITLTPDVRRRPG
jgi:hypothetical protein